MKIQILKVEEWLVVDKTYYSPMQELRKVLVKPEFSRHYKIKPTIGDIAESILNEIANNLYDLFLQDIVPTRLDEMEIEHLDGQVHKIIKKFNCFVDVEGSYEVYKRVKKLT